MHHRKGLGEKTTADNSASLWGRKGFNYLRCVNLFLSYEYSYPKTQVTQVTQMGGEQEGKLPCLYSWPLS